MTMAKRAIGLLMVVWATACAPSIEEPDVRLAGVRLAGLGLEGGVAHVELSVRNPNGFALEAEGLTYNLDLQDPDADEERWIDFADGRVQRDFRVEERDSATIEIPVEFRYEAIGGAVQSIMRTGTVRYRVRGEVAVREPLGAQIPYRKSGVASLGQLR